MTIGETSLREFLERLSASTSEPGGGAAAAVAGAMAVALLRMVGGLGATRRGQAQDTRRLWAERDATLARDQAELLAAADRDGAAYAAVVAARRSRSTGPRNEEARHQAVQLALTEATRPPLEIARRCASLADHRAWLAEHGAPAARSDIACAFELARAARAMALHTARINIASLDQGPLRQQLETQVRDLSQTTEHD